MTNHNSNKFKELAESFAKASKNLDTPWHIGHINHEGNQIPTMDIDDKGGCFICEDILEQYAEFILSSANNKKVILEALEGMSDLQELLPELFIAAALSDVASGNNLWDKLQSLKQKLGEDHD